MFISCKNWRLDLRRMGCLRSWVGMIRGVGHRSVAYGVCFFSYAWSDSQRQILGYVFVVTFLIKVYFVEETKGMLIYN